jgi:hypothetical protein
MEDSSLFNEQEINDPPLTARSAESQKSVSSIPETKSPESAKTTPNNNEDLEALAPGSNNVTPKEAIPPSSTWGSTEFFEDAFASSPFNDPNSSGKDAFGFPEAMTSEDQAFFDDSPDAWGEPSSLKSSIKPVDFTPRRNNASHFPTSAFDNDAMSYDASEMSEVTNPTFVTHNRPDADGEEAGRNAIAKKAMGHIRHPSQGSSSQEPSESAVPLLGVHSSDSLDVVENEKTADGSESQKENSGGGNDTSSLPTVNRGNKLPPSYANDDPPIASLEESSDEEDNSLDISKDPKQSTSPYAKSRIMEKYSKSGKLRKPLRYDNKSNPPSPTSQTLATQKTTTAPIPKTTVPRSFQPEIAKGIHSKQQPSFSSQRQEQESNDSSFTGGAAARRNERIQRTNRLQQEKRETAALTEPTSAGLRSSSPNTSSLVYRRRAGKMSPSPHALGLDKSIDNSFSSESKARNKDLYITKKKSAPPSVVDDPDYYNVSSGL